MEEEPEAPADQVCEPAVLCAPVGILVELDEENVLMTEKLR